MGSPSILVAKLPSPLRDVTRWLLWRYVAKPGQEKLAKVPYYLDGSPRRGALDTPDDIARLGTFDEAAAAFDAAPDRWSGIGYALVKGDGVGAIDLDNCLDENQAFISEDAEKVYEAAKAAGCYLEVSPSGRGVRGIGRSVGFASIMAAGLEAYASKRFVTLTGDCLANSGGWGDVDGVVQLMGTLIQKPGGAAAAAPKTPTSQLAVETIGYVKPDRVEDGGRNNAMIAHVGHLRGSGMPEHLILDAALDFNLRCVPPLGAEEIVDIVERYSHQANPVIGPTDANDWPDPEEIKEALAPVPVFDLGMLPDVFAPFVKDTMERMGQPADYIAIPLMIAAAATLGSTWAVAPKALDRGWLVPFTLWGGIVGRSGTKKSACIKLALRPVHQIEALLAASHAQSMTAYRAAKVVYDQAVKAAALAAKKKQFVTIPHAPVEPVAERLLVNDVTYQKLADINRCSPRGLLSVGDEIAGTMASWDQKGQEAARAFYLTAWNGDQPYHIDRVGAGSTRIERAFVCLLGGFQPSVLTQYIRQATDGGSGDDGLVQRFQLIAWPDFGVDLKEVDRPHDKQAEDDMVAAFFNLRNLTPQSVGASIVEGRGILVFSPDAQKLYARARDAIDRAARSGSRGTALSSHLSKTPGVVAVLAGLIHLLDGGSGPISMRATRKAVAWFSYLLAHAERVYGSVASAKAQAAKTLANKIEVGDLKDGFTARDIARKSCVGLSSSVEINDALDWLVDAGWLRAHEVKTRGRPSIVYDVNPKVAAKRAN